MKLYDYLMLMPKDDELTVWDKDYDVEIYFDGGEDDSNPWQKSMIEISKLLTITEIKSNGVTVDLSDVIESNLSKLKKSNLFIRRNIDSIMADIMNIFAGYASEEWMKEFAEALK